MLTVAEKSFVPDQELVSDDEETEEYPPQKRKLDWTYFNEDY